MPGVLIIEALAQTAGLLVLQHANSGQESYDQEDHDLFYLTGVDKAKFKRMVVPGDQLIMKVSLLKHRFNRYFKCLADAFVDDGLVCSCEIMAARSAAE